MGTRVDIPTVGRRSESSTQKCAGKRIRDRSRRVAFVPKKQHIPKKQPITGFLFIAPTRMTTPMISLFFPLKKRNRLWEI